MNDKGQIVESSRKFYRTVIEIEILSEAPFPDGMTLSEIDYEMTDGEYSGVNEIKVNNEQVSGKQMVKLLEAQGSDAGFFRLNTDGEDEDDDL